MQCDSLSLLSPPDTTDSTRYKPLAQAGLIRMFGPGSWKQRGPLCWSAPALSHLCYDLNYMGFPGSSVGKESSCNLLQCRRPWFDSWVRKIPWRRDSLPIPVFLGFPGGSDSKEFICNVGDLGLIPGFRRSPGGGHGNPLQYSCLENPHDREAWQAHGVAKSWT